MQQQVLESGTSQLSLRVSEAAAPARASGVIGGAMGVRQDYYAPFGQWLSSQGFRVTTFNYRGSGGSLRVNFPVLALSITHDELMTWRGTQNLINLYSGASRSFERITPGELGVKRIGHFGFFRQQFRQNQWPHTVQILERMRQARPAAGVPGTTA